MRVQVLLGHIELFRRADGLEDATDLLLRLQCAVGIDRAVFATVFNLSRQARSIPATISLDQRTEVENVFKAFTKADALAILLSRPAG